MLDNNARAGDARPWGYKDTTALYEAAPLEMPRMAAWNGINVEHHRQPPGECKLCLPKHTICILLRECHTERRVDGHFRQNDAASGEIMVYPASSEQWVRWRADAEFLLLFLDSSLVTQAADELVPHSNLELRESEKEIADPLLQQIGLALKSEIDTGLDPSSSLYAESLATALSAHLLRRYTVWKPTQLPPSHARKDPGLRCVLDYIHDNLDQPLTLTELAFIAHMSIYHFARTFKQFTGMSPHQYVLNARIECAKGLLREGKLSISEIASKVGFFDQSHFTRAFKRIVGVTPQVLLREKGKKLQ